MPSESPGPGELHCHHLAMARAMSWELEAKFFVPYSKMVLLAQGKGPPQQAGEWELLLS